jgi:hydrogenase maturation protein HypF
VCRRRWLVTGQVQGVGFRPFVFRIARQFNLSGFVRNQTDGVTIEGQATPSALRKFDQALRRQHPTLAHIRHIHRERVSPDPESREFRILESTRADPARGQHADLTVDTAVCQACVREMLCASDRRHRYALTNCTNCGPRFTIVRRVPYDRCNTTMASFSMCPACREEYTNPSNRRFHAQPIACHDCGPRLSLIAPDGTALPGDPIETARQRLLDRQVLAIKGLGGFHLAVRADDESAVRRLRSLKRRDHKPFALMVPSIDAARQLVELSTPAAALMASPACPIVLAPRRADAAVAPSVAPSNHRLGVMVPYTPIHHLIFHPPPMPALVMTSGNLSDDPLITDNDVALRQLGPMCDALLLHDRPIQRAIDDSVMIDLGDEDPIFVRRARGHVPRAIELPGAVTQGLCVGGELKNTIAVVRDGSVILSQHLGDLTHPLALENFKQAVDDLRQLNGVRPEWIAHDLHPMYLSTAYAQALASQMGVPTVAVQHHHAHAAALMAEHGITDRILAIVCDGTGFGTDGTTWGGELLACDRQAFQRLARLRPLHLPGGDAAARDTRRCGLAALQQIAGDDLSEHPAARRLVPDTSDRAMLCRMLRGEIACAPSSGAGRYFDAVAALLGLCAYNHHEAQAAIALESAAHRARGRASDSRLYAIGDGPVREIDLAPLVAAIVSRVDAGASSDELAWLFHEQLAQAWARAARDAAAQLDIRVVGLTGGVFCNALLTRRLTDLLNEAGLTVLRHRLVPPNDGGIALGQAAVAAAGLHRSGPV